jgi:hypothetical protein
MKEGHSISPAHQSGDNAAVPMQNLTTWCTVMGWAGCRSLWWSAGLKAAQPSRSRPLLSSTGACWNIAPRRPLGMVCTYGVKKGSQALLSLPIIRSHYSDGPKACGHVLSSRCAGPQRIFFGSESTEQVITEFNFQFASFDQYASCLLSHENATIYSFLVIFFLLVLTECKPSVDMYCQALQTHPSRSREYMC